MRYADFGANIVGMTILTSGDTIKKNPDLVQRFVRATAEVVGGVEEESRRRGRRRDEGQARPQSPVHARPADGRHRPARLEELEGHASAGARRRDWDQTLAILKNYRELQTDKAWTTFHTNEFLPQ